jgi:hypothetical protein
MPTPRVNPDRTLTNAERQRRKRDREASERARYRDALELIMQARTLSAAKQLAAEALQPAEQEHG